MTRQPDPTTRAVLVLRVGDPRRVVAGRAVAATLVAAVVFMAFAFTAKEVRPLYAHAPWQNDPYDAAASFAIFLVPLGVALVLLRALLCRRDAPLSEARLVGALRASLVVLTTVALTVVVDWISVGLGADRATWDATTVLLVGWLLATTAVVSWAAARLRRAAGAVPPATESRGGPDGLADALTLAAIGSRRLGPLRRPTSAIVRWLGHRPATMIRRHRLAAAALFAALFGAAVASSAAREEGVGPIVVLFFGVATCGMYAFTVGAGAYLGVVRPEQAMGTARRRVADASVAAAAAVPLALAFRNALWWLIDTSSSGARLAELGTLLVGAATAVFIVTLGIEGVLGIHGDRVRLRRE